MAILGIILFVIATDLLAWRSFEKLFARMGMRRNLMKWLYWGATLFVVLALTAGNFAQHAGQAHFHKNYYTLFGAVCLIYLPKAAYLFVSSLIPASQGRIAFKAGMLAATVVLLMVAKALWIDRTDFRVEHTVVQVKGLPPSFKGYTVVLIADTHFGCWGRNTKPMQRVVDAIQDVQPDLILFAGDMVINFDEEIDPFIPIFSRLQARDGLFAITGNHDYGQYYNWPSEALEQANFEDICTKIEQAGFRLLLNSHTYIVRNGDSLLLAGIENFSLPPRPARGNLTKTFEGADTSLCTVLLSHDPVFFALNHKTPHFAADLTLSGHTHEFQFAVQIGRFRWSPASLLTDYPSGLYYEGNKGIFVTRGIGSLGFPGRFEAKPQIAVLHLVPWGESLAAYPSTHSMLVP